MLVLLVAALVSGRHAVALALLHRQLDPALAPTLSLRHAAEAVAPRNVAGNLANLIWVQPFTLGMTGVLLLLATAHPIASVLARRRARRRAVASGLDTATDDCYRALVQHSAELIVILDPAGTIVYHTPSVERVLQYEAVALAHRPALDLVHPADRDAARALIDTLMVEPGRHVAADLRVGRLDGAWRELEIVGQNLLSDPRVRGLVLTARDVSEQRAAERDLRFRALHDSLTRIPNRALFSDRLDHALARRRRDGSGLAVLFFDLDVFKAVNDSLGHEAGDHLLILVAQRLQAAVRPGDTVARLGGDEFTVLIDQIAGQEDALRVSGRIAEQLSLPFELAGHVMTLSASIGIAIAGRDQTSPDELLRQADMAMYVAKSQGKARYAVFNSDMESRLGDPRALEVGLPNALDRQQLRLN